MEHMKALLHHRPSSAALESDEAMSLERAERERRFIAQFSNDQHPLPPDEMYASTPLLSHPSPRPDCFTRRDTNRLMSTWLTLVHCRQQDPRNKSLGGSSKGLTLRDFELVRTLGTGASPCRSHRQAVEHNRQAEACILIIGEIGTFARVWLVRLASPAPEDRHKVYALKVLRKAEGRVC